ncbi:hypothetical protein ACTJIJ_19925 [Niabella sp. 22666]|uniref:hypothetical protein n=1 Tax=Niabella sp. 22666 TaxID=3453954 RepID=UPI003F82EB56
MPDTVIDVSEIVALYDQYYLGNRQRLDFVRRKPFQKFETKEAMTLRPTNATRLEIGVVDQKEILQAYQDTYTPKGEVKFGAKFIDLVQVKIDQKFNPNKLMDTFLGYMADSGKMDYDVDRAKWEFVRWFIEDYLLGQTDEDIELKVIFGGSRVEPTPGTAGAAINAMTGLKKLINDGVTAGNIVPLATGAISTDPVIFVGQVEAFVKQIDEDLRKQEIVLNMSNDLEERFIEGMQQKYNVNYAQVADLKKVRNYPNITVAGRRSFSGSTKIIGWLKGNMVLAVKGFSNKENFLVKEFLRDVYVYTDWWMGLGYKLGEFIFTNDVELT